jgi:A-kinase anchor protein 6
VNKLDEFIQWLNEAMETTENWTPPKAETDSLRLYLETHLVGKIMLWLLFLSRISMLRFV